MQDTLNRQVCQNISEGFIKLYRSVCHKSWYKKSEHVHLFLHLLLKATYNSYETLFNGKTILLKPGQLVTGRKKLSDETGLNESKVERLLNFFEIEQQIEQQKTTTSRLISIVNWENYQKREQPTEQRVNNERTTSEQRVNTIQESKEGKKQKERKKILPAAPVSDNRKELSVRESDFRNSLIEFIPEFGERLINRFADHWTQQNKSATKMGFELQRTWDLRKRLNTWKSNEEKWSHNSNKNNRQNENKLEHLTERKLVI